MANAGLDQAVHPGDPVTLDGSESFSPQGEPISYQWEITSMPEGSTAEILEPALVNPGFVADLPGEYVVQLIVAEFGGGASEPDTVTISTENSPPVADTR